MGKLTQRLIPEAVQTCDVLNGVGDHLLVLRSLAWKVCEKRGKRKSERDEWELDKNEARWSYFLDQMSRFACQRVPSRVWTGILELSTSFLGNNNSGGVRTFSVPDKAVSDKTNKLGIFQWKKTNLPLAQDVLSSIGNLSTGNPLTITKDHAGHIRRF